MDCELMLSITEAAELAQHEATIERGLKTFVDVGQALLSIRDDRLYRAQYGTFEDYCRERWGWERRHAYRLMDAAQAVENVSNWTQIQPATESQARPLTQLKEPEQQINAWQRAVETAPNGKITAAHVQTVVNEITGKTQPEPVAPVVTEQPIVAPLPHVAHNSGNNEWYTPKSYIEAATHVLGSIDLDPASTEIANTVVQADIFYTVEDDGLSHEWSGRVWMNPPYAAELVGKFCDKLAQHVSTGEVPEAIVLVNNATETGWFNTLIFDASAVCFPKGRVKFWNPNKESAPLQGQALIYIGSNPDDFCEEFLQFGWVARL